MRCKLAFFAGIFFLVFSGCSHERRVADVRLKTSDAQAYIFGFIKVYYDGKDVTKGTKVQLGSGQVLTIDGKGFYANGVAINQWNKIKTLRLAFNNKDYGLSNLWIRTGPVGSKSCFGHITVQITRAPSLQKDKVEEWNWTVDNTKWKESAIEWSHYFKQDKLKLFLSTARRTGSTKPSTRKIATDRQEVDFGF